VVRQDGTRSYRLKPEAVRCLLTVNSESRGQAEDERKHECIVKDLQHGSVKKLVVNNESDTDYPLKYLLLSVLHKGIIFH